MLLSTRLRWLPMRDIAFLMLIIAITPFTFRRPLYAAMAYAWISIMVPHRLMWGFAFSLPLAMYFAAILLISLAKTNEPLAKNAWHGYLPALLFLAWTTLTTTFALAPDAAYNRWDAFWKMHVGLVMTLLVLTDRKAITSLIWVLALSIGFYGVKGGLFTLLHGGAYRIWGPVGSAIEDNNHLAVALLAAVPMLLWLREQSMRRPFRIGLAATAFLCAIAALGTYSRGALIAATVGGVVLLIRANRKLPIVLGLAVFIPLFLNLMPDEYWARMQTINTYDEDASVQGRFAAWYLAVDIANLHPLGGGFEYYRSPSVAAMNVHEPGVARAAHSIYFQVIGDQGWIGFSLYVLLLLLILHSLGRIRRLSKKNPQLDWAHSLSGYLQISMVFVLAGGAFLSLAYWEFLFYIFAIAVSLQRVARAVATQPESDTDNSTKISAPIPLGRSVPPKFLSN